MPTVVEAIGSFCDQPSRDDVRQFFEAHPIGAVNRQVRQSLESIDRCIRTKNQQSGNLTAFLR